MDGSVGLVNGLKKNMKFVNIFVVNGNDFIIIGDEDGIGIGCSNGIGLVWGIICCFYYIGCWG